MAKKAKSGLKLPKRLLGVKVPKQTRKHLNGLLSEITGGDVNALVTGAVGSMLAVVAERLSQPKERPVRNADRPTGAGRGASAGGSEGPGSPPAPRADLHAL